MFARWKRLPVKPHRNRPRRPGRFGAGVLAFVPVDGRRSYTRADELEYLRWQAERWESQQKYETGCYAW